MRKLKYYFNTIGRLVSLLIAVSIVAFALIISAPVDPMTSYIGSDYVEQDVRDEIAEYWGLNEPPVKRFITWADNAFHGDLGKSITYNQKVSDIVLTRFKASMVLMGVAWVFSGVFGVIMGILAAVFQESLFDKLVKVFCLILQSSPTFWIGLIILYVFSIKLGWFPIGYSIPIGKLVSEVTFIEKLHHIVLPAMTLSIIGIGKMTLYTREKMIEVLNSEYVLYAKTRGENMTQIVMRHGLRNISLPAITLQFAGFSELFGGIALAESVFSYPGLGNATTLAALNGDAPLLISISIFSAIFVFMGNLIANLLYGIVDPRIREGGYHA